MENFKKITIILLNHTNQNTLKIKILIQKILVMSNRIKVIKRKVETTIGKTKMIFQSTSLSRTTSKSVYKQKGIIQKIMRLLLIKL